MTGSRFGETSTLVPFPVSVHPLRHSIVMAYKIRNLRILAKILGVCCLNSSESWDQLSLRGFASCAARCAPPRRAASRTRPSAVEKDFRWKHARAGPALIRGTQPFLRGSSGNDRAFQPASSGRKAPGAPELASFVRGQEPWP